MIVLELSFDPTPERLAARPAHRSVLDSLARRGILHLAGPFADDSGALLVFDAPEGVVSEVIAADPYYRTVGVRVVSLREWSIVAGQPAGF